MSERKRCSVVGCDLEYAGRGYCNRHYQKWLRWGDPAGVKARTTTPLEKRFWPKVDVRAPDQCWPFTGNRGRSGYGLIFLSKREGKLVESAHRVAVRLSGRHIPEGMVVLHSCDNPPCCNPAHLRVGTAKENTHDMLKKGRGRCGTRPNCDTCGQYIRAAEGDRRCAACTELRGPPLSDAKSSDWKARAVAEIYAFREGK